ncbi:3-phosphoserine/phosphohydroxythreonine transaminase [Alteromonas sp. ASW11-130]|uniref:3-phosphoserine/phosphohydroxythreonine transaminase n=1 Tax=Alteromonas sp. ASW11-130 TaxID=3015775 RepID=UPI0022420682|nr:3-phosphoserine/phosphohydroxythreonine transaminase [Alteromonas sp. ASW11-130]MCW8092406.1 3-phosphoserine/phosphohydroxythreonine transaminase [Alteromonas sp. ASW11-130]
MTQVFNFSAGPAMLPPSVLRQAREELLNWQESGSSVMEVSHRGDAFRAVATQAETDLRKLMQVPENYHVLFTHGGGRAHFAAVPLNLSNPTDTSLHLVSGSWSKGAVAEASKFNHPKVVGELTQKDGLDFMVKPVEEQIDQRAAYLHFCPNETVDGVAYDWLPESGKVPLVADMSSCILSKPIDVSKYGVIYAGAQKNIGPSGLSVVIIRDDLVGRAQRNTPSIFDYNELATTGSMYNTPPTFSWYLAGLVFKWLLKQGGVDAMAEHNQAKAKCLYDAIDNSSFYQSRVHPACRSIMNVPFQLADPSLDDLFLTQAAADGLVALKGHRFVGGMRASIYNAMPLEGVQRLVEFMQDFERRVG